MLLLGIGTTAVFGKRLTRLLLPQAQAQAALVQAQARRAAGLATFSRS